MGRIGLHIGKATQRFAQDKLQGDVIMRIKRQLETQGTLTRQFLDGVFVF